MWLWRHTGWERWWVGFRRLGDGCWWLVLGLATFSGLLSRRCIDGVPLSSPGCRCGCWRQQGDSGQGGCGLYRSRRWKKRTLNFLDAGDAQKSGIVALAIIKLGKLGRRLRRGFHHWRRCHGSCGILLKRGKFGFQTCNRLFIGFDLLSSTLVFIPDRFNPFLHDSVRVIWGSRKGLL